MNKIKNRMKLSPITVYDDQELTALKLILKTRDTVNKVIDGVNYLEENSIQQGDDFKGSWHGITHPAYSEPGIAGVVVKNSEDIETLKDVSTSIGDMLEIVSYKETCPEIFGAVGNGVTDDTLALEKMLELTSDFTKINLKGKYKITRPLTISNKNYVSINDGIIEKLNTVISGESILYFENCGNIFINHCKIDGVSGLANVGDISHYGIQFNNCSNVFVNGNTIVNTKREGVRFDNCNNIVVNDNLFDTNGYAYRLGAIQTVGCTNVTINSNLVTNAGNKGISVNTTDYVTIVGNVIYNIKAGDGIFAGGCTHGSISNNVINGVEGSGDGIKLSSGGQNDEFGCTNFTVSANEIRNVRGAGTGLRLTGLRNSVIIGNNIRDCDGGIPVADSTAQAINCINLFISNNRLENLSSDYGIDIRDNSRNIEVVSNSVSGINNAGIVFRKVIECICTGNIVRNSVYGVRALNTCDKASIIQTPLVMRVTTPIWDQRPS